MICVDHLIPSIKSASWPFTKSAHLFQVGGTEDELHDFAKSVGLRRSWYQGDHYDLSPRRYPIAVRLGAKLVDRRSPEMREFLKRHREMRTK